MVSTEFESLLCVTAGTNAWETNRHKETKDDNWKISCQLYMTGTSSLVCGTCILKDSFYMTCTFIIRTDRLGFKEKTVRACALVFHSHTSSNPKQGFFGASASLHHLGVYMSSVEVGHIHACIKMNQAWHKFKGNAPGIITDTETKEITKKDKLRGEKRNDGARYS